MVRFGLVSVKKPRSWGETEPNHRTDRYFITGYKIAVKTGQYVFRLDQFDFKTLNLKINQNLI